MGRPSPSIVPLKTNPSRVGNERVPVVVPVLRIARIQPDKPTPTTAHAATMIPAVTAKALPMTLSRSLTAAPAPAWHQPRYTSPAAAGSLTAVASRDEHDAQPEAPTLREREAGAHQRHEDRVVVRTADEVQYSDRVGDADRDGDRWRYAMPSSDVGDGPHRQQHCAERDEPQQPDRELPRVSGGVHGAGGDAHLHRAVRVAAIGHPPHRVDVGDVLAVLELEHPLRGRVVSLRDHVAFGRVAVDVTAQQRGTEHHWHEPQRSGGEDDAHAIAFGRLAALDPRDQTEPRDAERSGAGEKRDRRERPRAVEGQERKRQPPRLVVEPPLRRGRSDQQRARETEARVGSDHRARARRNRRVSRVVDGHGVRSSGLGPRAVVQALGNPHSYLHGSSRGSTVPRSDRLDRGFGRVRRLCSCVRIMVLES